jgi:signal transduction histidine kinase
MDLAQLNDLLPLAGAVAYTILLIALQVRNNQRSRQSRWFSVVLATAILWELGLFLFAPSPLPNLAPKMLALSATLLGATTAVYVGWSDERRWLMAGGVAVAAAFALDLLLPRALFPLADSGPLRATSGGILALFSWFALSATILIQTWRHYGNTHLPWHANRLLHWLIYVLIVVVGELLTLSPVDWGGAAGQAVRFYGIFGLVRAISSHRLFDVRARIRKAIALAVIGLASAVPASIVLTVTLWLAERLQLQLGQLYAASLLVIAAGFLLYQPFRRFLERIIYRYLLGQEFQTSKIVRRYSRAISRTLGVEQLSQVIIGTISELLHTTRGALMLVSRGRDGIELETIPVLNQHERQRKGFASNSLFIETLAQERSPLLQYELDFNPYYETLDEEERTWLAQQGMEVYVPIHDSNELAGLIALGPKRSGLPYRSNELELVQVLAEQTVIALQNARLYSELNRQNDRIRSLNTDLREHNERLEILDRIKSDFITIASHELRTPLTQVKGYTEILASLNEQGPLSTDETRQIVNQISRASSQLETLLAAMLDASELEISGMELSFVQTQMEAVLELAMEPLAPAIGQRNLHVNRDGLADIPAFQADFQRLTQAFHNIVGNAIKYTPDHGTITISAALVPNADGDRDYAEVVVADTGVGIDPQYHDLIFEKFFRIGNPELHSTGSTKYKGAGPGLGLHIAKGVIEAHGGHIWVESEGEDEERLPGSRFHVVLPLTPVGPQASASVDAAAQEQTPAPTIR